MKRDRAAIRQRLQAEPFCRLCPPNGSWQGVDPHHVVPRSITQDDSPANVIPLCRTHHDLVEAKEIDLLPVLTREEQGHAVGLVGIERARMLLAPSAYREPVRSPWQKEAGPVIGKVAEY